MDNGYATELITVLVILSLLQHYWLYDHFHKMQLIIVDKIRDIFIKFYGKL